jgi:peptidyl-prolyl cis-trans isomerase D
LHIIKAEEHKAETTLPLEQVRDRISGLLIDEKAREIAYGKARELGDQAYALKDLAKAAASRQLPVLSPDTWFAQNDTLSDVVGSAEHMPSLFALSPGEVSDVLETSKGFLIVQLREVRPPEVLALEKVKERVEQDYIGEQAQAAAQKDAQELLQAARTAGNLEQPAKQKQLAVKTTEWFSRREPEKDLDSFGEAVNEVYQLTTDRPFPEAPIDLGQKYLVCHLISREIPPKEVLAKERAGILRRLLVQKQAQLWQSWRELNRGKSRVEIYQEH